MQSFIPPSVCLSQLIKSVTNKAISITIDMKFGTIVHNSGLTQWRTLGFEWVVADSIPAMGHFRILGIIS